MGHLLYSARDRHGKPVEGFVEAASAHAAREQLAGGGMTEIVLHQDPALGGTDARYLEGLNPRQQRELARVSLSAMRSPGLLGTLRDVAYVNRWWLLIDLAVLAWGIVSGSRWLVLTGAVLLAWPFAVALWTWRHSGRYNALLRAFAVGDWPRVRALANRLRVMSGKVENLGFDLDLRVATIAARDGRLHEALTMVERWREPLAGNPGLFEQRVAPLYYAGGNRQGYLRGMAEAHAAAPGEASRAMDLALAHARFGAAAEARRLLDAIDLSLLPSFGQGFVLWTEGLVRLRQQQPGALEKLSEAVAAFLALAANPVVWTALAFCTCDHAVALALAGRKGQARRELADVWPILQAHGDRALLRMLEADGLAPTESRSR